MRITVSVEKSVVERARMILRAEGKTTMNQEIRDYLANVANDDQVAIQHRIEELRQLHEKYNSLG
jgi:hypothetical protein